MTFFCRICHNEMELPEDAEFINSGYRSPYKMYRFDGRVHDLIPATSINRRSSALQKIGSSGIGAHVRQHVNRGIKREGCPYCFKEKTQ